MFSVLRGDEELITQFSEVSDAGDVNARAVANFELVREVAERKTLIVQLVFTYV